MKVHLLRRNGQILNKRHELTKEIYTGRVSKNEAGVHYNTFQDKDSHGSEYTKGDNLTMLYRLIGRDKIFEKWFK